MRLFFFLIALSLNFTAFAQIDISEARSQSIGTVVTVQGIVTNGSALGSVRYLQDETAGIAAFPGTGSVNGFNAVGLGDRIEVTGPLINFNGLLEISPIQSFEIISSNNAIPDPMLIGLDQLGEANEGQLVKISNVVFPDGGDVFDSSVAYTVTSNGESSSIFLRNTNPLVGTTIPTGAIELTAISSEFNDPQLLPRGEQDIAEQSNVFAFSEFPEQTDLEDNSLALTWETNFTARHWVNYGETENLGILLEQNGNGQDATIEIANLEPNTFYYVQAFAEYQNSVISAPIQIMSTASTSSGDMRVYFNHEINEDFSDGSEPNGTTSQSMVDAIANLIDNARSTLDVCLFNIDQPFVINALNDAVDRGVRVRFVANDGTANNALGNGNKNFDVIFVNPFSLMHNKFFVADAEDIDNAWILTGSTNITEGNLFNDYNNMILIQDNTLAKAYTMEFEEIWGSTTDQPNPSNSQAGDDKVNNTPHLFKVDNILIESYFSPSDRTTAAIINTLNTAEDDINFALLSFTKDDIAETLIDLNDNGVVVTGLMENINDNGSEFDNLNNNGVLVRRHSISNQLHHKYALIDAETPSSDPTTITGSHNWSNGAERDNDENTLIIHDASITNIYLQEFKQRNLEIGPKPATTNLLDIPVELSPNPSSNLITLSLPEGHTLVRGSIQHLNGQIISEFSLESGHNSHELFVQELDAGLYFLQLLDAQQNFVVKKLVKL